MQYYVKSAGKGYNQDYVWIQFFGKERDCTHLLRQMVRELSARVPSMAIFYQEGEYYLLIGGLNAGRTDIVGTPINNTFAFVCPIDEEQNIRFLVAGILSGNTNFNQLLFSAICEDTYSQLGFCVSDNFVSSVVAWMREEGEGALEALINNAKIYKSELASFLQNNLPLFAQNVLLVNSDKENNSSFCMFSAYEIDLASSPHGEFYSKIVQNDAESQLLKEGTIIMNKNEVNTSLFGVDETDNFKIFLRSAPKTNLDYYFWNNLQPEWAESIQEKLFYIELDIPGLSFSIAIETEGLCYHVYLQDEMSKITDYTGVGTEGRKIRVKLFFEFPIQIKGRTKEDVECGIRSICASWTDVDSDYGNKVLREIIERKALIITDASFEVNEGEMKKILWDFFSKGNNLGKKFNQHEVCRIAENWNGFEEAKCWFGEKLRTTCFSYDNSLLCYFTPCEVREPEQVSYCARWSREAETIIPKSEMFRPIGLKDEKTENEKKPNSKKSDGVMATKVEVVKKSDTDSDQMHSTKTDLNLVSRRYNRFLFIGIGILIVLMIIMIKSCSTTSNNKEEQMHVQNKMEQSSAKEENVFKDK